MTFVAVAGPYIFEYLRYFVIGLTNENPAVTTPLNIDYHRAPKDPYAYRFDTASVIFPPTSDLFRYVIIHVQLKNQVFCLTEVKVFLRGQ